MILKEAFCSQLQKYTSVRGYFLAQDELLFGNNGMGKTNLLDAIHYLSFCKSHVNTPDSQIINSDQDLCVVQGNYDYEGREGGDFSVPCGVGNANSSNGIRRSTTSCPSISAYYRWSWSLRLMPT